MISIQYTAYQFLGKKSLKFGWSISDNNSMMMSAEIDLATLVESVERCLSGEGLLHVEVEAGTRLCIYPHRLVYLSGDLTLIGEKTCDKSLLSLSVEKVREFSISTEVAYQNNFSSKEIDDFINAARAVSGNEERLVLKLESFERVDLTPPFHFWGSPYIVSNFDGEMIWGASVEFSDKLLEWLVEIHREVEVLDTPRIQDALQNILRVSR